MDEAPSRVEIDEQFIAEWFHFGMTEMRRYLQNHAAFAAYLDSKEQQHHADQTREPRSAPAS